jgi:hypothetical protein
MHKNSHLYLDPKKKIIAILYEREREREREQKPFKENRNGAED